MIKSIIIMAILLFSFALNANADDSDRINQLENEIQEIKLRLSKLESPTSNQSKSQEVVISSDGWKSIANWRKLTKEMGTDDVRQILGEPHRVDGGNFTKWYYQNQGVVIFYEEKVYQWQEPRQ